MLSTAAYQASSAYRSRSMSPAVPSKNLKQIECTRSRPDWFQSNSTPPLMNLQNINSDLCPVLRQPNSILERPLQTLRGGSGATIFIVRSMSKPIVQRGFLSEINTQPIQGINIARKCMPTNHAGLKAFMRDVEAGASENNSHFLQNDELNELLKVRRPRLLDCYSVTSSTASLFVADYPCVTDTDKKNQLLSASKPLSDYIMRGLLSVDECVDHTLHLVKQLIQEQKIYGLQDIPVTERKNVFLASYGHRAMSRWEIQNQFNPLVGSLKNLPTLIINEKVYKNPFAFIQPIVDSLESFSKGLITHGDCQQSNNLLQRIGSTNSYRNQRIDTRPLSINDSFMDIIKLLAGPAIIQSVDRMHAYTVSVDEDSIEIGQYPKNEEQRPELIRLEHYRIELEDYLIAGKGKEKIELTDFNKFCQKVFQHVAHNSQTQENYAHLWLRLTTWVELACAGGFCFQGLQKSQTDEEQLDFTNRTLTFVCTMAKELPKIKMHLNTFLETHKDDISLNSDIKNQLLTLQNSLNDIDLEISPEQD